MTDLIKSNTTRRTILKTGAASAALLASPAFLRLATAATPIKIGIPPSSPVAMPFSVRR